MGTTKKPKALIEAEKKITELEKSLASEKSAKDTFYRLYNEMNEVVEGIHLILTDLGVREYKDENKYNRLPLTVRLFSWAMSMAGRKGGEN